MKEVRINPVVVTDLKAIRNYIADDNEENAQKTIEAIYEQIENIQRFPNIGAKLSKRVSFRTDYQYVVCGNYIIFYKNRDAFVEIMRVLNRYQDLIRIFK